MPIPTSTILYKHFKNSNEPIRALIIETKSTYEQALKRISGVEWYHIPNGGSNSLGGLDFDVIVSQDKRQQYENLITISNTLHIPLVSLENNLPANQQDVIVSAQQRTSENVYSYGMIHDSWQLPGKVIYEPINPLPFNENKIYGTVFIDIDQQTMQLGQELSQIFPLMQIAQDNKEEANFQEAGVYLNLASPNPDVLRRIRLAIAAGCAVFTWNHPLFKELVVDGLNGSTFGSPQELVQKLQDFRKKGLDDMKRVGKGSHSIIKTKLSFSNFEKEWKKILNNSNKAFLGV